MRQVTLFCTCGRSGLYAKGRCKRCYQSCWLSRTRYGGRREQQIVKDGGRCTNCGSLRIVVHHRTRRQIITLCDACHAKVHRTLRLRYGWLTEYLLMLWREQHPGWPEQLVLPVLSGVCEEKQPEQVAMFAAA